MIQHPIPQNVTSYQFRLIGDMTIKQFVFLSVGVGAAIAFYYTNLFFFLKWFFVILSAVLGFAVAFMPIEERPLDQWIVSYLRAIYSPTYYIWKKQPTLPAYFTHTPSITPQAVADATEISRIAAIRRQQGLSSYLTTLPQEGNSDLDAQERAASHNFTSMFQLTSPASPKSPESSKSPAVPIRPSSPSPESPESSESPSVSIRPPSPSPVSPESSESPVPQPPSTTLITPATTVVAPATTSTNLPFPSSPTIPNVIVGMVIDPGGKIVPGAIVEVLDESGLPARATKTNQLGQFFSTTPLKRGVYLINIDKQGLDFDTIELQLTGQIVEPLKIQAKSPITNH